MTIFGILLFEKKQIPFIHMPFLVDLLLYFLLLPLWWWLGVDQILTAPFLGYELIKSLAQRSLDRTWTPALIFALALAIWSLTSLYFTPWDKVLYVLKQSSYAWSQAILLFLLYQHIRTKQDVDRVLLALRIFAFYFAASVLIYVLGIWRGHSVSVIGHFLPQGSGEGFVNNIRALSFGKYVDSAGAWLTMRVTGIARHPTSVHMVVFAVLPAVIGYLYSIRLQWKTAAFILFLIVLTGLGSGIVGSVSRMAYMTSAGAIGLSALLSLRMSKQKTLLLYGSLLAASLILFIIFFNQITDFFHYFFVEYRKGSFNTRFRIYTATWDLLKDHWLTGWGYPVRIGRHTGYSAGTHSGFLGILFFHGAVGMLLYLGILAALWKNIVTLYFKYADDRVFWGTVAGCMIAIHVSELAKGWWADQTIALPLWLLWGIILSMPRVYQHGGRIGSA
jgi:hypothetical protein